MEIFFNLPDDMPLEQANAMLDLLPNRHGFVELEQVDRFVNEHPCNARVVLGAIGLMGNRATHITTALRMMGVRPPIAVATNFGQHAGAFRLMGENTRLLNVRLRNAWEDEFDET